MSESEIYLDEESSYDAQNLVDDFAPFLGRDERRGRRYQSESEDQSDQYDESEEVEPVRTNRNRSTTQSTASTQSRRGQQAEPTRSSRTQTSTTQGKRRQQSTRASGIPADEYDLALDDWRYQSEFFTGNIATLYERIGSSGSLYYPSLNNKGTYTKSQVLMAAYSTNPSAYKTAFKDLVGKSYNSDWLGRVAERVRDAIEAELNRQFDHCTIRYSTGEQARPSPWSCKDTALVFFPPEPMMVRLYDNVAKDAERKRIGKSVGNKYDWYPPTTISSRGNKYRDSVNAVYPGSILYTNDNLKIQIMTTKDPYCIFQYS